LAERSDTLNSVSFARRKAGIFLPELLPDLLPDTRSRLFVFTVLHGERSTLLRKENRRALCGARRFFIEPA